jgi:zinc-finger of acetyl-transferase ESCO
MKTFGSQNASNPQKQLLLVERSKTDEAIEKKSAFLALFSQKPTLPKLSKKKVVKEKDTKQQLYLNIGGKTITKCDECGMEFNRIFEDDVRMHSKYHAVAVEGYSWNLKDFSPGLDGYLHITPPDKTNAKAWQKV